METAAIDGPQLSIVRSANAQTSRLAKITDISVRPGDKRSSSWRLGQCSGMTPEAGGFTVRSRTLAPPDDQPDWAEATRSCRSFTCGLQGGG